MRALGSTVAAVALLALSVCPPAASAWSARWDFSKRFKSVGHAELECGGKTQPVSCCICESIVQEIETQLNNTPDDYEIDVVFRISEEKKKIKYSRSEARILEVLDTVCDRIPLHLPESNKKKQRLMSDACTAFVGEFDDELTKTFFNNFDAAKDRLCGATVNVCTKTEEPDTDAKTDEL